MDNIFPTRVTQNKYTHLKLYLYNRNATDSYSNISKPTRTNVLDIGQTALKSFRIAVVIHLQHYMLEYMLMAFESEMQLCSYVNNKVSIG